MEKNNMTEAGKPVITKDCLETIFDNKYLHVFDMQYAPGMHYYNATRRPADKIAAIQSDEDFKKMIPDAVSCFVIVDIKDSEPVMLCSREFRYPTGRFVLSVPAGLIDPDDALEGKPALTAAAREINEETGLVVGENDRIYLVNPLVFSTPGMTDESNALVCAVIKYDSLEALQVKLTQDGAEGSELFDGFEILTKAKAREYLKRGTDDNGIFYPVYTWMGMMYFVSDLWME